MKKLLAILVLVLFGTMSYAQWVFNSPNEVLMPTAGVQGNIGLGVTNPTNDIQVTDLTGPATLILNSQATPTGSPSYNFAQYDMRWNGNTGDYYRNVLRRNTTNSHTEMLQILHSAPPLNQTMNFMYVDLNTQKFEMQSGIGTAEFLTSGPVLFNNTVDGGKVGIGVTAPADFKAGVKFQVNGGAYVAGRVRCHEVEVALAATFVWPDYVFNTGYNLKPLYEVESFVMANKHLPGVPSQAEIASDGVKLGEMNATLLQKVEELTLYMINLQKENDALKVRVSNLEK